MHAFIIGIGDELTLGQTVDTNSSWLSEQLMALGIPVLAHLVVPDDRAATAAAIRQAAAAAELTIVTGGLGPTQDDLTRDALADAAGAPLEERPDALAAVAAWFKHHQRTMSASNRVQALCPRGSDWLDNDCGTAPGLRVRIGQATVYAFPGVPREMKSMFLRHLAPTLAAQSGRVILTRTIRTFGEGESQLGERLGELMRRGGNPVVGTTVSLGVVSVRVRSEASTLAEAEAALQATVAEIQTRLGELIYGADDDTLARAVGRLLKERGMTLATAESCTGGGVAAQITDIPGASAWFRGGWVVYSNALKTSALGVPTELIAKDGSVSESVARAMAAGALARGGADCALALTGIAGPDGGTVDKPVGTVWIALAMPGAGGPPVITAQRVLFPGDRAAVRDRAGKTALNMLRQALLRGGGA